MSFDAPRGLAAFASVLAACGTAALPAEAPTTPETPAAPLPEPVPSDPAPSDPARRVTIVPVTGVRSLSVGAEHACAARDDGRVLCWGNGDTYRLGTGRRESAKAPQLVPSIDHATRVAAGGAMSCALKDDGSVACWGGYRQRPGDEDGFAWPEVRVPVTVSTPPTWVVDVDVGWTQAVLRDAAGGVAILDAYLGPVPLPRFAPAVGLAALDDGFCALTAVGRVACVTSSESGAGGDGGGDGGYGEEPGWVLAPVAIDDAARAALRDADGNDIWSPCATWDEGRDLPAFCSHQMTTAIQIDALDELGCAVQRDGTLACWGCADCWDERRPDLGFPVEARFVPVPVEGVKDVVEVAVGYRHLCTLHKGGAVRCWGDDSQGQLGPRGRGPSRTPVDVPGLGDVVHLDAGNATTCALRRDGTVACWGHTLGTPLEWPTSGEDTASVVPPDHPAERAAPAPEGKPAPRPDVACVAVDVLAADGELFETRYGYDAEGRVTRAARFAWRDGQAVLLEDTTYELDRAGRVVRERHMEPREDGPYRWSTRYRHDKRGNVVWKKSEGWVDDSVYTYRWDDRDRLVGGVTSSGGDGRLAWHERPAPAPFDGLVMSEADNEDDGRFGLDALAVRVVRDAAGREVYVRELSDGGWASDITTTWDDAGRVTRERTSDYKIPFYEDPSAIEETRYTYAPEGRLATTEVWSVTRGDDGVERATLARRTVHLAAGCL